MSRLCRLKSARADIYFVGRHSTPSSISAINAPTTLTKALLFNFQWLAQLGARLLFPLVTRSSHRQLFINRLFFEQPPNRQRRCKETHWPENRVRYLVGDGSLAIYLNALLFVLASLRSAIGGLCCKLSLRLRLNRDSVDLRQRFAGAADDGTARAWSRSVLLRI
jgi:hypothetical protein